MNGHDVRVVESHAGRVVQLIREFIDELRSFKNLLQARERQGREVFPPLALLASKVDELGHAMEQDVPDEQSIWPFTHSQAASYMLEHNVENKDSLPWMKVIHNILHPLINNLGRCYAILDAVPTPKLSAKDTQSRKQQNRPPPPPGLLSIQHYMDIGVLLECAVCMSILPLMDPNILATVEQRLKVVPKSLLGRTPLLALREAGTHRHKHNPHTRQRQLLVTSSLIGNIIHLERFRPILLPRHMADVYAAYFQAEHLATGSESYFAHPPPAIRHIQTTLFKDCKDMPLSLSCQRARSFQTLLLQGRQGPIWLRRRVSGLLNHLATACLEAVVAVFVHSAIEDKTAAASRLAQTLVVGAEKETADDYYSQLLLQLLDLLDRVIMRKDPTSVDDEEIITLQFIWMVLDQIPDKTLGETLFNQFTDPFIPKKNRGTSSNSIHRAVRRLKKLLTSAPSTVDHSRFYRLVLLRPVVLDDSSGQGCENTLPSLMLRLSCTPSVLKSSVKEDAIDAVRSAIEFVHDSTFSFNNETVDGINAAVVLILYCLTVTYWDLAVVRFQLNSNDHQKSRFFDEVSLTCGGDPSAEIGVMDFVDNLQQLTEHLVREIVASSWQPSDDLSTKHSRGCMPDLPSRLLEFLLYVYLRDQSFSDNGAPPHLPDSSLKLTAMIAIPYLCELCPMESLLSGSGGRFRLLHLTRTVFSLLSLRQNTGSSQPQQDASLSNMVEFELAERLVSEVIAKSEGSDVVSFPWMNNDSSSEFGASLAKILLNLLACILELGSFQRSPKEEEEIAALIPPLESLATIGATGNSDLDPSQWSEINEAASHVLVLIGMRSGNEAVQSYVAPVDSPEELLRQAEIDLQSSDPPLRARGVSSLRHFVMSRDISVQPSPRITLLSQDNGQSTPDYLSQTFLLLLRAIGDSESYVYLGAIHSLASIAAYIQFFPILLSGIATGTVTVDGHSETLLPDQRIKLAEVGIGVLRRSPAAQHKAPMILNVSSTKTKIVVTLNISH